MAIDSVVSVVSVVSVISTHRGQHTDRLNNTTINTANKTVGWLTAPVWLS